MFYSPEDLQWIWVLQNLPSLLRWFMMEKTGVRCGDVLNENIKCFLGHSFGFDTHWTLSSCDVVNCTVNVFASGCVDRTAWWNDSKLLSWDLNTQNCLPCFCDGYPLTELMRDTNSIHFLVLSYFEHSYILCVQCYVHVICYFSAFFKAHTQIISACEQGVFICTVVWKCALYKCNNTIQYNTIQFSIIKEVYHRSISIATLEKNEIFGDPWHLKRYMI